MSEPCPGSANGKHDLRKHPLNNLRNTLWLCKHCNLVVMEIHGKRKPDAFMDQGSGI